MSHLTWSEWMVVAASVGIFLVPARLVLRLAFVEAPREMRAQQDRG